MTDVTEIGTYRRLFDDKYAELDKILAGLPTEALLWKPAPGDDIAGLGWLLGHGVSSTVYLLKRAEWVMGRLDWKEIQGDQGKEEFTEANHDSEQMRVRARRTQEYVHGFLASLSAGDLDSSRPHAKRPELVFTARYEIQHAIEHLSQHIGHAGITRQLWEKSGEGGG